MIPAESRWWKENQNRTQRVQIAARVIPLADYTFITQEWLIFLGGPLGNIPTPQFQSPTFPSSQPILLEWAVAGVSVNPSFPGTSTAVSVVGFPSDLLHAMTGDALTSKSSFTRGCVIVQWSYQGVIRSQVCDPNAGTLAISLADWVAVTVLAPDAGEEGPSIVSQTPFLISVYPNHGGRRTTATLTCAPQSLTAGFASVVPLLTWANVDRWRWWWAADNAGAPGQGVMITVSGLFGAPVVEWYEPAAIVPPFGGWTPLLVADRWQAWIPGSFSVTLTPLVAGMYDAQIRAYIKSEV